MQNEKAVANQLTRVRSLIKEFNKPLTFREAVRYLGFSPSYLYKLTSKNEIPHYKPMGKKIFFFRKELDEWIVNPEESKIK